MDHPNFFYLISTPSLCSCTCVCCIAIAQRKQTVNDAKTLCLLWRKWGKLSLSNSALLITINIFFAWVCFTHLIKYLRCVRKSHIGNYSSTDCTHRDIVRFMLGVLHRCQDGVELHTAPYMHT